MYTFGKRSLEKIATLHDDLQMILEEAIKVIDFSIIEGHRGEKEQNEMYAKGTSKLKWPNSKHNTNPSLAVDIVPYPIDWENRERFYLLAGVIFGIAQRLDIKIRWGGDWDMDWDFKDQSFDDLPHFELVQA